MKTRTSTQTWAGLVLAVATLVFSTGCAHLARAACYATLEPNCGGIDYDFGVKSRSPEGLKSPMSGREAALGQNGSLNARQSGMYEPPSGMWYGPGLTVSSLPQPAHVTVQSMPEGFYSPGVARRVKADRQAKAPPAFVDLEGLGYLPGHETFAVAHEGTDERADSDALTAKRQAVLVRSLGYIAPYMEYDQGARVEWHSATRRVDGRMVSYVSCRAAVSDGPPYWSSAAPSFRGEALEHDILTDKLSLQPGRIYFSPEKSIRSRGRSAQLAALAFVDLPPGLFELKAKLDASRSKLREVEARIERLSGECLRRKTVDRASDRKCSGLGDLEREYLGLRDGISAQERHLAPLAQALQAFKLQGMAQLSGSLMAHVTPGNEMRFYVRFDIFSSRMNVIAILDNPLPPADNG